MSTRRDMLVMDISPWPSGSGFGGSHNWWNYLLSKGEKARLDNLLGAALLDDKLRNRLVVERDRDLMDAFGLSDDTKHWLCKIDASSLSDLAQAIVNSYQMSA